MKKFILLSVSLAFLLPLVMKAAVPDMKFRRLDTRDGLSNSQVLSIYRDSKGFVWIGTPYGLNRYDGYRVKTYYSETRDTTTLRSNYVDAIFEANDGKLWLKQGMGYSVFDPVTERCDRHPERQLEKQGITGGLEYLFVDSIGDFWVKSYNDGFFHYSPKTKKLKRFNFGYGEQEFNLEMGVSSMVELDEKTVALASHNGEIICFDREHDVISRKMDYLSKNGLISNQSCKLRVDLNGNLWVITPARTCSWNPKTNEWSVSVQEALGKLGITDLPAEMQVWDILPDERGRLWLATDHGGLYVVDPRDHTFKQFLSDKIDESTISDNTLRVLYHDQLGRFWIGSYMNGLNLYIGNSSNFRNMELGVINTICYDKEGYTWLGTNDAGIIRYDSRTGEQVVYNKANSGIGSNVMVGSLVASDGSVWFGTYEGGLIHIKNGSVTNYRATGDTLGLVNNNVWSVCEDQWGNIWIGTLGGGVQRIDKHTGKMRTFRISNSNLPSDYVSTITRTKKGWLMVSHSSYYSLINPKTFRIVNRDITNNHNGIDINLTSNLTLEDSRGLAWQGSTSGATIWDPKTNEVYLLDMKSGFLGSTVNGIAEDAAHTMWVVTDHGISNVIVQKQDNGRYSFIVRSYNSRDGLQNGPYNQRSTCFTPDGLLLVGGQGGLDILNVKNIGKDRVKEVPIFSGLLLFDEEVPIGSEIDGRVILKKSLNEQREVTLKYGDQFTIQLSSSSGEIHNRSRFVYQLEGFNDNWVRTAEVNPNISYMSLRYGDYTLHVRMLKDDGTMGEDEATIEIHIATPFWRARWAMLLYILLVLAAVWWWRRYFLRRQTERMALEQQRREIEKMQWMNEMRAQLAKEGVTLQRKETPEPQEELTFMPAMEDIVAFVRTTVNAFKMPEEKACKLSFSTPLNGMTTHFDSELLGRLINILIGNSVKFSPRGARIKVTLTNVGDMAELRIADHGLGIPEYARAHMFDADADSGIGLGDVKRIVDLHGGNVFAEDNPDGGTIFVVQLPVNGKPAADDIPIEEAVIID